MRKYPLFSKGAAVMGLFLLLTVPLMMIKARIAEREHLNDQVAEDIAASYSQSQTVMGPVIYIPYRERSWYRQWNKELEKYERAAKYTEKHLIITPRKIDVHARMDTRMRYRGIYGAPVYHSGTDFQGSFDLPAKLPFKGNDILVDSAYLLLAVDDMRGLTRVPEVDLGSGKPVRMGFGADIKKLDDKTLFVDLGSAGQLAGKTLPFRLRLALNGTRRLGFLPAAGELAIRMESDWAHPGFNGLMLPEKHEISDAGFSASWHTNRLAASRVVSCIEEKIHCADDDLALNVDLVRPVTGYLSTERAVKYGYLFILLTFAAFLLFEVMKRLRIHGMQYLLVGMALTMFYLLLLALSEHLAFGTSYLIAASACVGLIGFYLRHVLRSWKSAGLFSAALSLVYAVLYIVLLSEDYALLTGSVLLFLILAGIMVATRRVDWYAYGEALGRKTPEAEREAQ